MKISYRWLTEWVADLPPPRELAVLLSGGGVGVESVTPWSSALSGVVVGRIVTADKHPNADRLKVCVVETGGGDRHDVVCGAPNVAAGMLVPFALPGAKLPGGKTIGRATIRGVASGGMLCSAVEVGLGSDAAGLHVLPDDAVPGAVFVPNPEDHILDLEITPNRGDLLSVLGIARWLGALLDRPIRVPWKERGDSPGRLVDVDPGPADAGGWSVAVADQESCEWYTARVLTGVTIAPSPDWLQRRLQTAGLRPINNVVDVTNFVMLEMGQPLHAFDAAKLTGRTITVRRAAAGETMKTLDGTDRKLDPDVLVIADGKGPVAAAGIMGGASSEITAGTTEVVIESAWFLPARVRRGTKVLGLASDSSYRFERGVDPLGVARASDRAAGLLRELAGAAIASPLLDARGTRPGPAPIVADPAALGSLLGIECPPDRFRAFMMRIGASVGDAKGPTVVVIPPSWRPDLTQPADLAEEYATLFGYDRIPATLPLRESSAVIGSRAASVESLLRAALRAAGASEAWTMSFGTTTELGKLGITGPDPRSRTVPLANPMTAEQELLRPTLLPGLLRSAAYNLARETSAVRLFELGTVFAPGDGGPPVEPRRLGVVAAGRDLQTPFAPERVLGLADVRGAVDAGFTALGLTAVWRAAAVGAPYAPGRGAEILVGERVVGSAGELSPSVLAAFDLPPGSAAAELELAPLLESAPAGWTVAAPPRYPAVRRDLAVVVPGAAGAGDIAAAIRSAGAPALDDCTPFDEYRGKPIPEGRKSLAFRLSFRAADRTLTEGEADEAFSRIVKSLGDAFGATLRTG